MIHRITLETTSGVTEAAFNALRYDEIVVLFEIFRRWTVVKGMFTKK
jgi:hypothetical protein